MMLYTLEDKALTSLNNYVRITIDTLFEKHLVEFENILCTLCLRGWEIYVKSAIFLNTFSGDQYFNLLVMGLFLGEGRL